MKNARDAREPDRLLLPSVLCVTGDVLCHLLTPMASFLAASLLIALVVSGSNVAATPSPSVVVGNGDIASTAQEMQRARYFTFVMLIRMVQEKIPHNTTFLMPNDRMLSTATIPESQVMEFLSRHSIPAPLMFDDLIKLPNATIVPTAHSSQTITITNVKHQKIYFNNIELISPDVCHVGDLFRCHGINGVIRPIVPRGKGSACPGHLAPATAAPGPASGANRSLETSSLTSPNMSSATSPSLQPGAASTQICQPSAASHAFAEDQCVGQPKLNYGVWLYAQLLYEKFNPRTVFCNKYEVNTHTTVAPANNLVRVMLRSIAR